MQMISFPGTDVICSRLGLGCMRMPMKEVDGKSVCDEEKDIAMIRKAIDGGITYLDTAYVYHDQQSERILGLALRDGYRDKVTIATKLPCWMVKTHGDMEKLLDEELERLQTDHIDFYLLHALNKERIKEMKALNVYQFLDDMVAKGKIRYPSFSFHDDAEAFLEILNDYPWKMAQVQMNLLDTNAQATMEGVRAAYQKGIGIVVMEPLRGGALAQTPQSVKTLYDAFPVKRTPVEWAMRFLYDMPEVAVILSGMSNDEQVEQNIQTFNQAEMNCMDDAEHALIQNVEKAYTSRIKTGCTGCEYCQPCPQGVKIPNIFKEYDTDFMFDNMPLFHERYAKTVQAKEGADQCIECGVCEGACPQHLPIIAYLKEIHSKT